MKRLLTAMALGVALAGCDTPEAPSGSPVATAKDPVCGMRVDRANAKTALYGDVKYYFCSAACRDRFVKDPAPYAVPTP
jgi:Cu+-exporting ATPase